MSFAVGGVPKTSAGKEWPLWGEDEDGVIMKIVKDGVEIGRDGVNSTRCEWWASI